MTQITTHLMAYRDVLTGAPALQPVSARHASEPGVIPADRAAGITPAELDALLAAAQQYRAAQARTARRQSQRRTRNARRIITRGRVVGYGNFADLPAAPRPAQRVTTEGHGDVAEVLINGRLIGRVRHEQGDGTDRRVWRIIPLSCLVRATTWGLPSAATRDEAIDALVSGDYAL